MSEKYSPKSPRIRVARTMENVAKMEAEMRAFRLGICASLGVKEHEISEKEWGEITEFAVNADILIMRGEVTCQYRKSIHSGNEDRIHSQLDDNTFRRILYHDIFHVAERILTNRGHVSTPLFATVTHATRSILPEILTEEPYPFLSFALPVKWKKPISVLIQTEEGRVAITKDLIEEQKKTDKKNRAEQMFHYITMAFANANAHRSNREIFELFTQEIFLARAVITDESLTDAMIENIRRAFRAYFQNPPEHYASFAVKVFSEEGQCNPRLYLDELLRVIRMPPEIPTT